MKKNPTGTCCSKCRDSLGFDGQKIGCCVNRACECHTENSKIPTEKNCEHVGSSGAPFTEYLPAPSSTWEEEFDAIITPFLDGIAIKADVRNVDYYPKLIKSFISKAVSQARTEGYYEGEKNEFHNQTGRIAEALAEGERIGREKCAKEHG